MAIDNKLLTTYEKSRAELHLVDIPKLNFDRVETIEDYSSRPMDIKHVNLDELHPVLHQMKNQLKSIDNIKQLPVYTHQISLWTIFLYILIIFVIIMLATKYWRKKKTINVTVEELRPDIDSIEMTKR